MRDRTLILKTIIIIFLLSGLLGFSQEIPHARKIKENFNNKNYQLTLDEIASINSSHIQVDSILYIKAYSQIKLNLLQDAKVTLIQLEQINPNFYEIYFLKGLLFALKEKYVEAIDNFNKVVELNPQHEKAFYNRALAKGLLEDYSNAIKDLDKCLLINPRYAMAYYNRGYWHEISENYSDAITDYKSALALDHNLSEAYLALAYAYSQNGEKTNACETLHKAKEEGVEAANDLIQNFCK
ncbi:MAG: hypothetical protein K0R26_1739 [Bacteroidota bacterium]|jgi:tetratricopeptide (TPR) repeat protein|nr:hypothetical protein [Bacteroidota bacterium]